MPWLTGLVWVAGLAAAGPDSSSDLEIAMDLLEANQIDAFDRAELERAALAGMMSQLGPLSSCPVSRLLSAEGVEDRRRAERGVREGIGAEFRIVPWRGLMITEVPQGSPAQRAGMRPGQAVISVHGELLSGRSAAEIADLVRRQSSGLMELEIEDPQGQRRVLLLPRSRYLVSPVSIQRGPDLSLARIKVFSRGSAEALDDFLGTLGKQPLILDLRDTPGGDLEEAVAAADLLLEPGALIGYERRRRTGTRPFVAARDPVYTGPIVVLVNGGTLGTAELFAAALQDNKRAELIGTTTAGLACATGLYHLPDGAALEFTDAAYTTPLGVSWQSLGLTPDRVEPLYPADALPAAVADTDPQLEAARRLLLATRTESSPLINGSELPIQEERDEP